MKVAFVIPFAFERFFHDAKEKFGNPINFEDEIKPQLSDKIEELKIRPDKCYSCKKCGICEGVWKGYYDRFGDDELKPIN